MEKRNKKLVEKQKRFEFIKNYIQTKSQYGVDILKADFVNGYIDETNAVFYPMFFGAPKCPQLGKDLSEMYNLGILDRSTCGLPKGDSSMGFPKWVYSYYLKNIE